MMPGGTTLPIDSDPHSDGGVEHEITGLVIAWCGEDPSRVGEIAIVPYRSQPLVLGRGEEGPEPRIRFFRQRPGTVAPTPALSSMSLSRRQLLVAMTGETLVIERLGGPELRINGEPCERGEVGAGDVVHVKRQLVLLCVRRKPLIPALRYFPRASVPEFGTPDAFGMLGEAPAAWRLRDAVAFAATAGNHTLVVGESGTGKELAARAIHALSPRSRGPFVARNAATIPQGLIDAELFGNVRNYPNPGMPERPGLVGQAHGGTLFLDEIGELPTESQAHLLRVLDADGEYQRLGDGATRRSDFRLIGATNRDPSSLKHDVLARFVSQVEVPSLSERVEDVPLLITHLVRRAAKKSPSTAARFLDPATAGEHARLAPALVDSLLRRRFSANVRDLDAVVWRAIADSPGEELSLAQDTATNRSAEVVGTGAPKAPSSEPSPDEIRAALESAEGNVARAAKALGLKSRYALYRLIKKLGIAGASDGGT